MLHSMLMLSYVLFILEHCPQMIIIPCCPRTWQLSTVLDQLSWQTEKSTWPRFVVRLQEILTALNKFFVADGFNKVCCIRLKLFNISQNSYFPAFFWDETFHFLLVLNHHNISRKIQFSRMSSHGKGLRDSHVKKKSHLRQSHLQRLSN